MTDESRAAYEGTKRVAVKADKRRLVWIEGRSIAVVTASGFSGSTPPAWTPAHVCFRRTESAYIGK
jgi:hypothetical protein